MAALKAIAAAARLAMAPGDGRAVFIHDKVVLGAAAGGGVGVPANGDTLDFFIPAGTKVNTLEFYADDCDTGAAFAVSIGYRPVSASQGPLAANAAYFQAAGAFAQSAGRVECAFKPITFEQDVWLTLTVTAAPAGIAGNPEIHLIAGCSSVGAK